jgi:hypothetical protein
VISSGHLEKAFSYFFQVPLQRDLIVAEDPALLLESELKAAAIV